MKSRNWITAAIAAIATILPGCDSFVLQDIKPGVTTAVEVRAKMGNPGFEFRNDDGGVTWEYTRQPSGVHCYMITFGTDQIVQKVDQVLNDASFAKVQPGMTRDQTRRLLGQPARVETFPNLRGSLGMADRGHSAQRGNLLQRFLRHWQRAGHQGRQARRDESLDKSSHLAVGAANSKLRLLPRSAATLFMHRHEFRGQARQ